MTASIECVVRRGGMTESSHRVRAFAIDSEGAVLFDTGERGALTSLRSTAKPFQAHAGLLAGAFDAAGWGERELALTCGSHVAEERHVAGVTAMLTGLGLEGHHLRCGTEVGHPDPIHNNCSGKHAGMLALAQHLRAPLDRYEEPGHPVQRAVLGGLAELAGVEPVTAVDGCGLPSIFLPRERAAGLFLRLADGRDATLERLRRAMVAHPFAVAGRDRFDTVLMEAFGGRLAGKMGAEGVMGLALRPREGPPVGIFLECIDGNHRAIPPVALALLEHLELLELDEGSLESLEPFARGERRNHAGTVVGDVEVSIDLPVPRQRG